MAIIEGYTGSTSVVQGSNIEFYINNIPDEGYWPNFTIEVFRAVASRPSVHKGVGIAHAQVYPSLAYRFGCRWPLAYTLTVPDDPQNWPSGVYEAVLINESNDSTTIRFVVRPRSGSAPILMVWPVTTYLAYHANQNRNPYDRSLYDSYEAARARVVSFDRPISWDDHGELKFWQWLDAKGYVVDACTSVDLHRRPRLLSGYRLVLSVGHDEYWSKEMRDHVEDFIARGGNVAFFSANTCWWQVRFENGDRTMVCHKSAVDDPLTGKDDDRVTANWSSAPVNRPENWMTGVGFRNGGGGWATDWTDYQYRVRESKHWVFAGTGVGDNDLFGRGVIGYETDAALFRETDTGPKATGRDGSPLDISILATADLGEWRYTGQGGFATMSILESGGSVFTAGVVDWAGGLDDPIIERVTKNVIDRLSSVLPPGVRTSITDQTISLTRSLDRVRADTPLSRESLTADTPLSESIRTSLDLNLRPLSPVRWPDHDWELIGNTPSIVGMTGYVERLLFAVDQNGDLYVREPVGTPVSWTRVDETPAIQALAAPALGLGRLIGASSDDQIFYRNAVTSPAAWDVQLGSVYDVQTMACMYPDQLYLINDDDEFWLLDLKGGETLIGTGAGIRALTAHDGKLFGATEAGELFCRETVAANVKWAPIGDAPDGTIALAAYAGILFAATLDRKLYWRTAACVPAPLPVGGLLFYNASNGAGATSIFAENGDLETQRSFSDSPDEDPAFALAWTDIVAAGGNRLLFYDRVSGRGATASVERDGTFATLVEFPNADGIPSFLPNWSHLTTTGGLMLFYNADDGTGAVGRVEEDGNFTMLQSFPDPASGNAAFLPGWTNLIPVQRDLVLFYNRNTGGAAVGRLHDDGTFETLTTYPDPAAGRRGFQTIWTHIVAVLDGLVILYDQSSDHTATGRVSEDGVFNTLTEPAGSLLLPNESVHWSTIIAGSNGLLLLYDKVSGSALSVGLTLSGPVVQLWAHGAGAFNVGWTNVAAYGVAD